MLSLTASHAEQIEVHMRKHIPGCTKSLPTQLKTANAMLRMQIDITEPEHHDGPNADMTKHGDCDVDIRHARKLLIWMLHACSGHMTRRS